jgi:hypothetical protein
MHSVPALEQEPQDGTTPSHYLRPIRQGQNKIEFSEELKETAQNSCHFASKYTVYVLESSFADNASKRSSHEVSDGIFDSASSTPLLGR